VVQSIPKNIKGVDEIEVLVIDDGSDDRTLDVAEALETHIIDLPFKSGLAAAFQRGIDGSVGMGADVIVNTDGDNQYRSEDIPRLIQPILEGYDLVVADRQTDLIDEFSPLKKFLQKFGSWVARKMTGVEVTDAVSGFRAYSRKFAARIKISSKFSHTLETLFLAKKYGERVTEIKVRTNPKMRESRLFKNIGEHVLKSGLALIRLKWKYR